MLIKIEPKFNVPYIQKVVKERARKLEQAVMLRFQYVGETFVKNAREKSVEHYKEYQKAMSEMAFSRQGPRAEIGPDTPGFMDHTGNLRSSIGYVILKNGELVKENFEISGNGTSGSEGVQKGKAMVARLKARFSGQYPYSIVLIVVAGMEYAAAVESKGYDVITSSSLLAENDLKEAIANLNAKISKM